MTRQILQDGVLLTLSEADYAAQFPAPPPPAPQTIFDPATLIQTLFTPAEQLGFEGSNQGRLFATLIAAHQVIDITSAEFKADVAEAVSLGLLTQDRASQVLAGTPAPQT